MLRPIVLPVLLTLCATTAQAKTGPPVPLFSESAGLVGRPCDEGLEHLTRPFGIVAPASGSSVWLGIEGSQLECEGEPSRVARVRFAPGWSLPHGVSWRQGRGSARRRLERQDARQVRSWKDAAGRHLDAVVDGVRVRMSWSSRSRLDQVVLTPLSEEPAATSRH